MARIKRIVIRKRKDTTQVLTYTHAARGGQSLYNAEEFKGHDLEKELTKPETAARVFPKPSGRSTL